MQQPLIQLEGVDLDLAGKPILWNITWQLWPGQHWAIIGPNGSGKSTLLKLIRGELGPAVGRGRRIYRLEGREQTATAVGIRELMGAVSPELQERYLQQDWRLIARDVILSGFFNSDYLYVKPTAEQREFGESMAQRFGITDLLDRNVQQLSTGELRKVLIARALVGKPPILLLDEVCDGLDVESRRDLLDMIEGIARDGTQILYASHRDEEFIPGITHVLELKGGEMVRQEQRKIQQTEEKAAASCRTPNAVLAPAATVPILIDVKGVDVFLERKHVLHDIHWQMRADEHWAIVGKNGSGKSTLLKLLAGDLHPAAGGTIKRFDLTPKNTLWDIRRRIGFLSPEFQANYRDRVTAWEVVASGFYSSIGLRQKPARAERERASKLLDEFGMTELAEKLVGAMSYGEFRKVLLLRAMVHQPRVLLCDEPFDGLDVEAREQFVAALEQAAAGGTRLVIVTHHADELPRFMTHVLELDRGRVVWKSPLGEVERMVGDEGFEPPTNSV